MQLPPSESLQSYLRLEISRICPGDMGNLANLKGRIYLKIHNFVTFKQSEGHSKHTVLRGTAHRT